MHGSVSKRERFQRRIDASLILKALRKAYKLKDLEEATGIPVSLISRYSNGDILPGDRQVEIIEKLLLTEMVGNVLKLYLNVESNLSVSHKIYTDPLVLWFASKSILQRVKNRGLHFEYIITPEVGGIPIGVSLSHISGATLLIARRRRSLGWESTITGVGGKAEHVKVYYMEKPRGVEGKRAIIVDDVVIEGDTVESLIDISRKSGFVLCCMYSVYGVGGSWKNKLPGLSVLYEA